MRDLFPGVTSKRADLQRKPAASSAGLDDGEAAVPVQGDQTADAASMPAVGESGPVRRQLGGLAMRTQAGRASGVRKAQMCCFFCYSCAGDVAERDCGYISHTTVSRFRV